MFVFIFIVVKLLETLKEFIQLKETMAPGSEPYDYYRDGEYLIEWWTSPHVYELRDEKPRIPDIAIFDKIIDESSPFILEKYFGQGKRFKEIKPSDQFHRRFIVRRAKGNSTPQMVVQIEELDYSKKKLVLYVLTFMDSEGNEFKVLDKGPKSIAFILDLVV